MAKSKINLICYFIRFRKKNSRKNTHLKFDEIFKGTSFIEFMNDFLVHRQSTTYITKDKSRILDIESINKTDSMIYGKVSKGVKMESVQSVKTKKGTKSEVKWTIGDDDYPANEYFYLITDPYASDKKGDNDVGLLVTQSYEYFGYKDLFENVFKDYIASKLKINGDDVSCDINISTNVQLLKEIIKKSTVKKLIFRKYSLPQNMEDLIEKSPDNFKKEDYEIETTIKAKRVNRLDILSKLDKMLDSQGSLLEVMPGEYDEACVEVRMNDKSRRILNISNPTNFGAVYDITKNCNFDELKQGNIDSIYREAKEILRDHVIPHLKPKS